MSLFYDNNNNKLYVGTAGRGLVLVIDLSTNWRILHIMLFMIQLKAKYML